MDHNLRDNFKFTSLFNWETDGVLIRMNGAVTEQYCITLVENAKCVNL